MDETADPPRIDALIRWAAARFPFSETAMIDARALAKCAFGLDDAGLIASGNDLADAACLARFRRMVERRAAQEPVAYIVGRREFWSLDLEMRRGVLIPRTDSETIVEAALKRRRRSAPLRIIDLGSGSGALLCALLSEFRDARGLGVDINPEAVALTAQNLARLGLSDRADAQEGDWFAGLSGAFDLIVANPPYVPSGDRASLTREVAEHESPLALFAGADGLDAYRRLFGEAPGRLDAAGLMIVEFGRNQEEPVKEMAEKAFPLATVAIEKDLAGRPRAAAIDLAPPHR